MRKLPTKSIRLWLARDENNKLFIYLVKPTKFETRGIWSAPYLYSYEYLRLPKEMFPNVKWEDKEPTRVTLRLS